MKIAIISDLHLGFRQYGSMEREEDFYRQFFNVCKEIKKHRPEIVIIAGDLFDKPNPTPAAINAYREGIGNLNSILCVTKGNHTMILREGHYSIDEYFGADEFEGYYYLDDETMTTFLHGMQSNYDLEFSEYVNKPNVLVTGITYRYNSDLDEFIKVQKELAEKDLKEDAVYKILVVHQSFKEFCGFVGEELSIEDIDYSPYDAVICGHIHSRFNTVLPDGTLFIQPGSIERMNTTEALDEEKNGKGFYLLDTEDNSLEFFKVECPRKFFLGEVKLDTKQDLENHLEELNNDISKLKVPPIISYKYKNHIDNIEAVRENISLMGKNILLNKSHIDDQSQEEVVLEITDNELPTVVEAISMYGEESGLDEKEVALALDIYNSLSGNSESTSDVLDNYFNKNKTEYEEEESVDEEFEELIRYFE